MRYLLDENLAPRTAATMQTLAGDSVDEYVHLLDAVGRHGTDDLEIPRICQRQKFDALITVNHKDFAAQKVVYQALIDHQIHVVALRPGKQRFNTDLQVAWLARYRARIGTALTNEADAAVLLVVTESGIRIRSITELVAEIEGKTNN